MLCKLRFLRNYNSKFLSFLSHVEKRVLKSYLEEQLVPTPYIEMFHWQRSKARSFHLLKIRLKTSSLLSTRWCIVVLNIFILRFCTNVLISVFLVIDIFSCCLGTIVYEQLLVQSSKGLPFPAEGLIVFVWFLLPYHWSLRLPAEDLMVFVRFLFLYCYNFSPTHYLKNARIDFLEILRNDSGRKKLYKLNFPLRKCYK